MSKNQQIPGPPARGFKLRRPSGDASPERRYKPRDGADLYSRHRRAETRLLSLSHLRTPSERALALRAERAPEQLAPGAAMHADGHCVLSDAARAVAELERRAREEREARAARTSRALRRRYLNAAAAIDRRLEETDGDDARSIKQARASASRIVARCSRRLAEFGAGALTPGQEHERWKSERAIRAANR